VRIPLPRVCSALLQFTPQEIAKFRKIFGGWPKEEEVFPDPE
jgi:hypothetical protein